MSRSPKCIVVAWTTQEQEFDGRPFARDLGALPGLREVTKPHACVWLNKGSDADIEKAQAFIASDAPDTGRVFVYPTNEKDPLGRARREILS